MIDTKNFAEKQTHLITISLYVTIMEHLCSKIIDDVRHRFRSSNHPEFPDEINKTYLEEVLVHSDDVFQANCLWLKRNSVVAPDEIAKLETLVAQRDEIIKNLPDVMWGKQFDHHREHFDQIAEFFHKVDAWSIKEENGLDDVGQDDMLPVREIFAWMAAKTAFPDQTQD
jgi:hypothetical protein